MSDTQSPPEQDPVLILDSFTAQTSAALAAAVDGLVWAALSVAGQKLRHTAACPRPERGAARELLGTASLHTRYPVPSRAEITHWRLMDDAWARVPEVAARYGIDPVRLTAALDEYVTALLVAGQPHEFDSVPRLLARMKWAAATPVPGAAA